MPTDPKETVLPLTHASLTVELAGEVRRFRVYTAVLLPRSRRRIRVRFEGPKGSVTLELPLVTFWQLTEPCICAFQPKNNENASPSLRNWTLHSATALSIS